MTGKPVLTSETQTTQLVSIKSRTGAARANLRFFYLTSTKKTRAGSSSMCTFHLKRSSKSLRRCLSGGARHNWRRWGVLWLWRRLQIFSFTELNLLFMKLDKQLLTDISVVPGISESDMYKLRPIITDIHWGRRSENGRFFCHILQAVLTDELSKDNKNRRSSLARNQTVNKNK